MTALRARWLAWGGFALAVTMLAVAMGFAIADWGRCADHWRAASAAADETCRILLGRNDLGGAAEGLGFGLMGLLFAGLGGVLGSRRPDNVIGWLFLVTGLMFIGNGFTTAYSVHAAEDPAVPFGTAAVVIAEVLAGPVIFAPFVAFFLLFPDGRLLSPRWRIVVWALIFSVLVQTLDLALHPGPLRLAPLATNPLGVAWLTDAVRVPVQTTGFALMVLCLVASVVSVVLRFRRSRGVERQQMKWFTTSSAFVGVTLTLAPLFWATPALEPLWGPLFILAIGSVPVTATIAILKYHLYDLGVLVNRALVYGALTALLGLIYVGLVFALQQLLSGVGGSSDVAVAVSTLTVAALFRPLRSRLQGFIDRRFYRRKYNARHTVEDFSTHLRQETDLGALRAALLDAVDSTIQPERSALWLRAESRPQ